MLISYPTSIHFGIVEFKVPNEASTHTLVSSVTNTPDNKKVSFNNPLHYSMPVKKKPTTKSSKKSLLKCKQHRNKPFKDHHNTLQDHASKTTPCPTENNASQDHVTTVTPTTIGNSAFQDHAPEVILQPIGNNALQDPTSKSIKNKSFQDHNFTVKDVQDIISLKNVFPQSFDTACNMPGVYTICLDPLSPQCNMQDVRSPLNVENALKSSCRIWWTKALSPLLLSLWNGCHL